MELTFDICPHGEPALQQELAQALRTRTDEQSRTRYPRLWAVTDKLNEKKRPFHRWHGVVLIVLGLFVSIPGFLKPMELALPLLLGLLAVLYGIVRLFPPRPSGKVFDRAAGQLLTRMRQTRPGEFRVTFSEDGMTITNRVTQTALAVPYENFECVVETENLLLLVYDRQVTVLHRADLSFGEEEDLPVLLQDRVDLL